MKVIILILILLLPAGFLTPATAITATQTSVSYSEATTHRPSFKQKKKHNWAGTSKVKKCKKSKRRR